MVTTFLQSDYFTNMYLRLQDCAFQRKNTLLRRASLVLSSGHKKALTVPFLIEALFVTLKFKAEKSSIEKTQKEPVSTSVDIPFLAHFSDSYEN